MKKVLLGLCLASFFMLSCSGGKSSATSEIDNICACIKKTEYYEIIKDIDFDKMDRLESKFAKVDFDSKESVTAMKCVAKNLKSVLKKYNDLKDDKQKGQLVRSTMTALINNECVATIFDKIPFDKMQDQLEDNEFGLGIKDIIKILEKIEEAKDFDDIQKDIMKEVLTRMPKPRMRYEEPRMQDFPMEEENPMEEEGPMEEEEFSGE